MILILRLYEDNHHVAFVGFAQDAMINIVWKITKFTFFRNGGTVEHENFDKMKNVFQKIGSKIFGEWLSYDHFWL